MWDVLYDNFIAYLAVSWIIRECERLETETDRVYTPRRTWE